MFNLLLLLWEDWFTWSHKSKFTLALGKERINPNYPGAHCPSKPNPSEASHAPSRGADRTQGACGRQGLRMWFFTRRSVQTGGSQSWLTLGPPRSWKPLWSWAPPEITQNVWLTIWQLLKSILMSSQRGEPLTELFHKWFKTLQIIKDFNKVWKFGSLLVHSFGNRPTGNDYNASLQIIHNSVYSLTEGAHSQSMIQNRNNGSLPLTWRTWPSCCVHNEHSGALNYLLLPVNSKFSLRFLLLSRFILDILRKI